MGDRHPYLDGPYPRAYAHRGWHVGDLAGCENTLAAFVRAADEGFGYVELDVHASSDGVPLIHHDPDLDRTTDATGRIADHRAAELDEVTVGGREPLPRLEAVLSAVPRTRVTIELKSDDVVAPTLAVLERLGAWDRVCLGSFEESRLVRARSEAGPRLCTSLGQRGVLGLRGRAWLDALPGPLQAAGVVGAVLPGVHGQVAQVPVRFGPLTVVDRQFVRTAHAAGREVHVWTVDEPGSMHTLLDLGVDGLLSDRPDLLREVLAVRAEALRPPEAG
ncbi:glycerophosphodiester phosphodiesterase family protein [Pseudonocardia sp. KRD291]|uniref:glycerophosphodiester phosphodiesterase family protein n=1 Tax=Pseudonocardia sp. KRD291 TaxID=2792007 RepID=UPI001C4A0A0F|nr:glycerophosphodiester phosphodiesterase family protein [Pseudonocardia sp. KRD291]MBW0103129.1 glycerophosphodiester phosphodiesterase [Pseudonocardia sp. KRD291]